MKLQRAYARGIFSTRFVGSEIPPKRKTLRLYRADDALRAERCRRFAYEFRMLHRMRIDGYLIRSGSEKLVDIVDGADSPTDRERDKDMLCRFFDDIEEIVPPIEAGNNIHVQQLIGAFAVISGRDFPGIAHNPKTFQMHPFDDIGPFHVKTGDDANACCHGACLLQLRTRSKCSAPDRVPPPGKSPEPKVESANPRQRFEEQKAAPSPNHRIRADAPDFEPACPLLTVHVQVLVGDKVARVPVAKRAAHEVAL